MDSRTNPSIGLSRDQMTSDGEIVPSSLPIVRRPSVARPGFLSGHATDYPAVHTPVPSELSVYGTCPTTPIAEAAGDSSHEWVQGDVIFGA